MSILNHLLHLLILIQLYVNYYQKWIHLKPQLIDGKLCTDIINNNSLKKSDKKLEKCSHNGSDNKSENGSYNCSYKVSENGTDDGSNDDTDDGSNDGTVDGSDKKLEEEKINIQLKITTDDIDKEISKCILGMERERKINDMNKKIIAYHEAGHAILGFLIADSIIPTKICISINSKSLGYTMFPQDDDDLLVKTTISQLMIEVMILYGGRMSEKIFINDITCGGEDDYSIARKILKRLLMNGMLVLENNYIEPEGEKDTKPNETIETQLRSINKIVIQEVEILLNDNSEIVHVVSNMILECGSITSNDIYQIFKTNNANEKIGSYKISKIINEIKQIL